MSILAVIRSLASGRALRASSFRLSGRPAPSPSEPLAEIVPGPACASSCCSSHRSPLADQRAADVGQVQAARIILQVRMRDLDAALRIGLASVPLMSALSLALPAHLLAAGLENGIDHHQIERAGDLDRHGRRAIQRHLARTPAIAAARRHRPSDRPAPPSAAAAPAARHCRRQAAHRTAARAQAATADGHAAGGLGNAAVQFRIDIDAAPRPAASAAMGAAAARSDRAPRRADPASASLGPAPATHYRPAPGAIVSTLRPSPNDSIEGDSRRAVCSRYLSSSALTRSAR